MELAAPASILPLPDVTQHALAAAWAMSRARHLLAREPHDTEPPDVVRAREAFGEAVFQLEQALAHAGGRPGHRQVEAALEEAHEALMHLRKPGVVPPIADVVDHAWRGGELAREAVRLFGDEPVAAPGQHGDVTLAMITGEQGARYGAPGAGRLR